MALIAVHNKQLMKMHETESVVILYRECIDIVISDVKHNNQELIV